MFKRLRVSIWRLLHPKQVKALDEVNSALKKAPIPRDARYYMDEKGVIHHV